MITTKAPQYSKRSLAAYKRYWKIEFVEELDESWWKWLWGYDSGYKAGLRAARRARSAGTLR